MSDNENKGDDKAIRKMKMKRFIKNSGFLVLLALLLSAVAIFIIFELLWLIRGKMLNLDVFHQLMTIAREMVIIIVSVFGLLQVDKWKKELLGRDQYAIARKMMLKASKLQRGLISFRKREKWTKYWPTHMEEEWQSDMKILRKNFPDITDDRFYATGIFYQYRIKYEYVMSLIADMEEINVEAKMFEFDIQKYLVNINNDITDLMGYAYSLYGERDYFDEKIAKQKLTPYDQDEIAIQFEDQITEIETIAKEKM